MAELDELLDLLNKVQSKEEESEPQNYMEQFIKQMNISKGTTRVPNYIIFFTYMETYQPKQDKVNKIRFFRDFNKYFDSARNGRQRSYLLEGEPFDLTREGKIEAKAYEKHYTQEIGIKTGRIKRRKRKLAYHKQKDKL